MVSFTPPSPWLAREPARYVRLKRDVSASSPQLASTAIDDVLHGLYSFETKSTRNWKESWLCKKWRRLTYRCTYRLAIYIRRKRAIFYPCLSTIFFYFFYYAGVKAATVEEDNNLAVAVYAMIMDDMVVLKACAATKP